MPTKSLHSADRSVWYLVEHPLSGSTNRRMLRIWTASSVFWLSILSLIDLLVFAGMMPLSKAFSTTFRYASSSSVSRSARSSCLSSLMTIVSFERPPFAGLSHHQRWIQPPRKPLCSVEADRRTASEWRCGSSGSPPRLYPPLGAGQLHRGTGSSSVPCALAKKNFSASPCERM